MNFQEHAANWVPPEPPTKSADFSIGPSAITSDEPAGARQVRAMSLSDKIDSETKANKQWDERKSKLVVALRTLSGADGLTQAVLEELAHQGVPDAPKASKKPVVGVDTVAKHLANLARDDKHFEDQLRVINTMAKKSAHSTTSSKPEPPKPKEIGSSGCKTLTILTALAGNRCIHTCVLFIYVDLCLQTDM